MLTAAAGKGFCLHQALRQQRGLIVLTLHFTQVGLLDVVEVLLAGFLQPLAHFFIGQDLMLQHAELRQRFAPGGAATRRHHRKHIPASDGGEMRKARQALKGTGKLLIRRIFSHSGVRSVTGE